MSESSATVSDIEAMNLELEIRMFTRKRFAALARCDHFTAAKWQRLIRQARLKLASMNQPKLFPTITDE